MTSATAVSAGALHEAGVEVRTLSGDLIATLPVSSTQETVGSVRHRLLKSIADHDTRRLFGQSHLVCGCSVLQDHWLLCDCCPPPTSSGNTSSRLPVLVLVCVQPSSLAAHMAKMEIEACGLVDVADAIFQAEHALSVRHCPRAEDVARNFPTTLRVRVLYWLGHACASLQADQHQLLHGAALTLDRYCACLPAPVNEAELMRLAMAALCTEMKLASHDDFPHGVWQRSLLNLSQGRDSLPDILETEGQILRQLHFNVWVPNASIFLRGLGMRLYEVPIAPQRDGWPGPVSTNSALQLALARVFIELTLYDVHLQYSCPAVALAAGALGAALLSVGAADHPIAQGVEHPAELANMVAQHEALLEDLSSYCPLLSDARGLARECERRILELWLDCIRGTSTLSEFYAHVCDRHIQYDEDVRAARFGEFLQRASPEAALRCFHALNS